LQTEAGFDALPALHAAMRQAAREHPAALDLSADGRLVAHALGWSADRRGDGAAPAPPRTLAVPEGAARAWRQAALFSLAIEEDLAIVDGRRASLPWLAVALPSHWDPRQKIGRHFAEVHAPVADNAVLVAAGEHLMKLVTAPQRWERFVWNVTRHPGLDAHPQRTPPALARRTGRGRTGPTHLVPQRTPDLHPAARAGPGRLHHPGGRAASGAGGGHAGPCAAPARCHRQHEPRGAGLPAAHRRPPRLLRWLAAQAACADSAPAP
jgi:hypothetical protein